MKFFNIIKDGIKHIIDEAQYEAIYKPAGWKIVDVNETTPKKTSDPHDEVIIKNTERMKRHAPQKFDDGLFRKDL